MLVSSLVLVLLAADPAAGQVVQGDKAEQYLIANGKGSARLLLNPQNGMKEAALTLLVLAPGAEVPEHVHESSAEILYVESGTVEMTIGGRPLTAHAGDAIYIPANVRHSAKVTSKLTPVRAVQLYVGPGPEQRFRKGPKLEGE